MSMPTVAAIIPAHNEEKTIGSVVRVLRQLPLIGEVIVVADGCVDQTAAIARLAGARAVELPVTQGKGRAMLTGVSQSESDIVVFFDADLLGLTSEHVEQIISPVVSGARAMNVGLRDRGRWVTFLSAHLPLLGGERAMRRSVIANIPERYLSGFMIETALNYFCRTRKLPYGSVKLSGLTIVHKYEKVGWQQGLVEYLKMSWEIIQAMIWVRLMYRLGKF